MSSHVDDLEDRRMYELEDSIRDKQRIMKWYDPDTEIKEKKSASYEQAQWRRIVKAVMERLKELKEEMNNDNYRPPLRTLWYDLVTDHFIVNSQTERMYDKFVAHLTDARHKLQLPPYAFVDETRPDVDEVPDHTPEYFGIHWSELLSKAHLQYDPPIWKDQSYHVEIWCEKLAQASMIEHILEDKQVSVQINRGHPSYTIMYEAYQRLKKIQDDTDKKIIILYCGDWDPDGDIMDEEIVDYLDRFGKRYGELNYSFEHVAVLAEHETSFGFTLPSAPAKKMSLKRRKTPNQDRYSNKARFEKRYGKVAQIELDALTSKLALPHFKKLLRDKVDHYWSKKIWDRKFKDFYTQKAAKEEIDRRIQLKEFGRTEYSLLKRCAELGNDLSKKQEYEKAVMAYVEFSHNNKSENEKKFEQNEKEMIKEGQEK